MKVKFTVLLLALLALPGTDDVRTFFMSLNEDMFIPVFEC